MIRSNTTIDDLVVIIKEESEKTNKKIDNNSRKIDEIKIKMAYVAWQIDMNEVKERLKIIETKVGIEG